MLYRILLFICVLAVASCVNNKDYTLDSLTITPTEAVPIATGNISILDFASDKDSSYLKTYSDGLLYFSYSQTFASRGIRALFDKPANNKVSVSLDLPTGSLPPSTSDTPYGVTIYRQVNLDFSPAQLSEMLLKGGFVNYTVSLSQATNPTLPLELDISLTDVVDNTSQVPLSIATSVGNGSKPLNNYLIKMTNNSFNIKLDLILKKRTSTVFIPPNTKLNVTMTFDTDFAYIKGFFGDRTVSIPAQTVDLTVFNSSLGKTKVSFVQPVLKLSVLNDYGVPDEITFSTIEGSKAGATIPFQLNPSSPININAPATLGASATTNITVTNANAIINFAPSQLSYAGSTRINRGLSSGSNFLADTSQLHITMAAEVPLYGQVSGFSLSDTLAINLTSINQSSVISAALRVKGVNEIPLDVNMQLYLTDKNYKVIDSLFTTNQTLWVKASSVTGLGELASAGVSDQKFDLVTDKINKLFTSSYIIVKSRLNTPKDISGTPLNVKFKSSYKMKLDLGLLAKLNITAK